MTLKFFSRAGLAVTAIFAFVGIEPAHAVNVQPLAVEMVAIGSKSRATLQVVNDSAKPMPIEIAVKKADIGVDGKLTETPAGEEFLVFPPQAVIPPGSTQNFRVQWVGAPDIKKSQGYMLYVNQIPVKMKAGDSGVQIVLDFGVILNVAPAGSQSALKVVSAEATNDGKKQGAWITVENPSEMYSYFSDAKLTLESGSWRKVLGPSQLKELIGYAVIQPGKTRRILVPMEVPAGAGKLNAVIEYKPVTAK
jgi:fimbrial chaperone protein